MQAIFKKTVFWLIIALFSAFTFVPPTHHLPQQSRFLSAAVVELPPLDSISINIGRAVCAPGQQVCLPFTVSGFEKILSMQYTMVWDPAVLRLAELRDFGLRGLGDNNFGTHLSDAGKITFSWYDPNLRGESRKDGSLLYELCFEALGKPGTSTGVHIGQDPTITEITNAAGKFLQLQVNSGKVVVEAER